MCGIAGYVLIDRREPGPRRLMAMLQTIRHRGPDDEGLALFSPETGVAGAFATDDTAARTPDCRPVAEASGLEHRIALGHRRFSIIDLSTAAHQPFWSADRRVCVAFNGEIYNYIELRTELERLGHRFRTSSDTEVLVAAYQQWGVECLTRLNGFWALTLYDARRGQVLLARDRIGKAPLYYARRPEGIYWCSEIKGLRKALGSSAFGVNEPAIHDFIRNGRRDLFHHTFFAGIETFPSASYGWIDANGDSKPTTYWSIPTTRQSERAISPGDAIAEMRRLLDDAVRLRMRADVPVGVELSGGLDSSAILSHMAGQPRKDRLRAFTVSFPGSEFDEAVYAAAVVDRYRDAVQQTVLTPSSDDVLDLLEEFVLHMDEPFHNLQLLTHRGIWDQMRAEGIRVSLNGAAGDEALAGYGCVYFDPYLIHLLRNGKVARFAREFLSFSERDTGRFGYGHLRRAYHLLPDALRIYRNPAMVIPDAVEPYRAPASVTAYPPDPAEVEQLLVYGMTQWPMNYYCRGGNHIAMSVPVEYRSPFLDYRLVEFAFRLPLAYLVRDGWLKWILRKSVENELPPEIVWRKRKGGFRYPLSERLPQSKGRLFEMLQGLDCPYVDLGRLDSAFLEMNRRNPDYLWRVLSVALWWKLCIQGQPPVAARRRA